MQDYPFYTLSKQSSNAESLFCKPVIPVRRKLGACLWSPREHLPSIGTEHSQYKYLYGTDACFFQHRWPAGRPGISDRRERSQRNQWTLVDTDLRQHRPEDCLANAIHSLPQARKVGSDPFSFCLDLCFLLYFRQATLQNWPCGKFLVKKLPLFSWGEFCTYNLPCNPFLS